MEAGEGGRTSRLKGRATMRKVLSVNLSGARMSIPVSEAMKGNVKSCKGCLFQQNFFGWTNGAPPQRRAGHSG